MDNRPPSVSVIIPTFNRAPLLTRSIKSVLDQTYQDFEIIIVDDASIDNTEEVVRSIGDPRIRYLKHKKNLGGSAARNTGIKTARGEFIAFQDSDDEWTSDKLDKQMTVLTNAPPQVGVVYTGFWRLKGKTEEYIPGSAQKIKEGNIHTELLKGNFVTTQAVLVKKECFQKAGMFDETLPRLQDWELFIRISAHYLFAFIDEPLVISYFSKDSISSNENNLRLAFIKILLKHKNIFLSDKEAYASLNYSIADLYLRDGKMSDGISHIFISLRYCPRVGFAIGFIAAFFGKTFYKMYSELAKKIFS